MKKLALGMDVGSSGCKAIAMDSGRRALYFSSVRYENTIICSGLGAYDQSADVLKEAALTCIREITKQLAADEKIGCIGVTGQMHGLVALDEEKRPLRPVISCVDFRNQKQNRELYEKVGGEEGLLPYTNNKMIASCTGGKILWMMEMEPELFKKVRCILNPKDYIRLALTGICATDESDASGFGLYDVRRRRWNKELLRIAGIPMEILPEVYASEDVVGTVLPDAAKDIGVDEDTLVIAGGGDAVMQTVASSGGEKGIYSIILGTGGLISNCLTECVHNEGGKLQVYAGGIKDQWVAYAGLMSVGAAIDWFRNNYYQKEWEENPGTVYRIMEAEAGQIKPGCEGLVFYPSLMGQRNPVEDPFAKGVMAGLSPQHERGHMYRALLEGLALGMKAVSGQLVKLGGAIRKIHISGGGAASDLWCQIFADVFQVEVCRVENYTVCGGEGCAVMGLKAMGMYRTVQEAFSCIPVEKTFLPDAEKAKVYQDLYCIYEKIYPAMQDVFKDIKRLEEQY